MVLIWSFYLGYVWAGTYKQFDSNAINNKFKTHSLLTHLACVWLAGWLSAAKPAGHVWPRLSCKENKHFHWAKSHSLWPSPPPPPQGIMTGGPPLVPAGSKAPGLSAPTLLDRSSPGLSSTTKASLTAIAGRQVKKFCPKLFLLRIPWNLFLRIPNNKDVNFHSNWNMEFLGIPSLSKFSLVGVENSLELVTIFYCFTLKKLIQN